MVRLHIDLLGKFDSILIWISSQPELLRESGSWTEVPLYMNFFHSLLWMMLRIEPWAWHILRTCSPTELPPQSINKRETKLSGILRGRSYGLTLNIHILVMPFTPGLEHWYRSLGRNKNHKQQRIRMVFLNASGQVGFASVRTAWLREPGVSKYSVSCSGKKYLKLFNFWKDSWQQDR